jgi:hypothetical protein
MIVLQSFELAGMIWLARSVCRLARWHVFPETESAPESEAHQRYRKQSTQSHCASTQSRRVAASLQSIFSMKAFASSESQPALSHPSLKALVSYSQRLRPSDPFSPTPVRVNHFLLHLLPIVKRSFVCDHLEQTLS